MSVFKMAARLVILIGIVSVLFIGVDQRVIGVVVDSVSDTIALQDQDIKPAPEFSGALSAERIIDLDTIKNGDDERMLILMNIEKLMTSAEMSLIAETTH